MKPNEIQTDVILVSYCGLYCGACKSYLKGRCPGCLKQGKYKKCRMRPCCLENNYRSCAECKDYIDVMDCKKYTNPLWNLFEFVFRTQRSRCIAYIKQHGYEKFARLMSKKNAVTLKRKDTDKIIQV